MSAWKNEILSVVVGFGIIVAAVVSYQSWDQYAHGTKQEWSLQSLVGPKVEPTPQPSPSRLEQILAGLSHDADLDGIPDLVEHNATLARSLGLNPVPNEYRRDLYIDIYQRPNATLLNATTQQSIIDYFDHAPLSNPHGVDGVALHLRYVGVLRSTIQEAWNDTLQHRGDLDFHVKAYFDDVACYAYQNGTCYASGIANYAAAQFKIAAERQRGLFGKPLPSPYQQEWLRHVFQHELEHVLWPSIPEQFWASSINSGHTNIRDDALCVGPTEHEAVTWDEHSRCDAGEETVLDRWHYASAFWLQKAHESLVDPNHWLHEL